MVFSSIPFLYGFLPALLILYRLMPGRARNPLLLMFSLFFYFWGEPQFLWLMPASAFSGWGFGLLIERYRGTRKAKAALVGALVVGLGTLFVFKYSDFFVENLNTVLSLSLPLPELLLPIGISFYTFQILSYDIDLYRGEAKLQRNFFDFAAYVTLFPQLIAGPIVRYTDVARELSHRTVTVERFGRGVRRFVLGLGKKVLVANVVGEICRLYKDAPQTSVLFTWLYIVAFGLQIYYDFSGYSDMAIGLGHMLGFTFMENFNYPYIAQSITEFWRRWHISLGTWFRDYVYIPLGGNRCSRLRQVRNILVVWGLTGFWHGAGWNFILWGLYFALFLLLEKLVLRTWLAKRSRPLRHLYVLAIVAFSWVLFDAGSLTEAGRTLSQLAGAGVAVADPRGLYTLRSYAVPLMVAALGATPLSKRLWERLSSVRFGLRALVIAEPVTVAGLLLLVTAYLIDGSFNPFIYFRF